MPTTQRSKKSYRRRKSAEEKKDALIVVKDELGSKAVKDEVSASDRSGRTSYIKSEFVSSEEEESEPEIKTEKSTKRRASARSLKRRS